MDVTETLEALILKREEKIKNAKEKMLRQDRIIEHTLKSRGELEVHILRWEKQQARDRASLEKATNGSE